ncbi:MAG TPA: biotin synthase BioB [Terriglobia bacterium]|nr:biotin synthase BioB [Terriglobia bacterium]
MTAIQPSTNSVRSDWTGAEVRAIFRQPLLELMFQAQQLHRRFHPAGEVQLCRLLSIKTGGCPEDCAYCPQSAHYHTEVKPGALMAVDEVRREAEKAREEGATRFCMGAAWREVREGRDFEKVLEMVREVASLDMEVCCTLGMLNEHQARRLAEAGLTAYNHNIDTSPEYYGKIITTRSYEDRLKTLAHVRQAGISVCCGGILGMGESEEDRIGLLHQLASMKPHPESVPINLLVRVKGTPMGAAENLDPLALVRTIAAARLLMPTSRVRLSAGRRSLTRESAALCFMAGANSIFFGEKLLTTPNPGQDEDESLFRDLGLKAMGRA